MQGLPLEIADLLGLDDQVVLGRRARSLEQDQVLLVEGAAHAHHQRADPLHLEVVGRELAAEADELGEARDAVGEGVVRQRRLVDPLVRLPQRARVVPAERPARPRGELRRRHVQPVALERVAVAAQEAVDEALLVAGPALLARRDQQRGAEPHQVDHRLAAGAVVEVAEPAAEVRHRVLLDVGVAVQVDLRHPVHDVGEQPARLGREGGVDEAEVAVRRGADAVHQVQVARRSAGPSGRRPVRRRLSAAVAASEQGRKQDGQRAGTHSGEAHLSSGGPTLALHGPRDVAAIRDSNVS